VPYIGLRAPPTRRSEETARTSITRVSVIVLLLSRLFSKLSLPTALAIGRFLGRLAYYLIPVKRGIARENVRRVFGAELSPREQRRIVRKCYESMCMWGMEVMRMPHLTPEVSEQTVTREGYEYMEQALARGKGAILVASHMDNVDLAGCSMAIRGLPLSVAVKEFKSKSLQDFLSAVRERTGVILIPPRKSKEQIIDLLKKNVVVTLVVDQHMAKHRAIVCEFFGQLAATSPAPARFAFETGAPIIPGLMYRTDNKGGHGIRLGPPMEMETPYDDLDKNIRHNTERINRIIEGWIREFPEQWLWLHKRWKVQDNPEGWDIPEHLQHLVKRPAKG